ncbi:MAG: hypothetical protein U0P30_08760 [Vicinamibacterales bacterium]
MQPVPVVSMDDVERILDRDFPGDRSVMARALLAEYGRRAWHREPVRVWLAALKLADGRLDRLRRAIDLADEDYRDVLSAAEYPQYSSTVPPNARPSPAIDAITVEDARQYAEWLRRDGVARERT